MESNIVSRIGPSDGGGYETEWEGPYLTAYLLSDVGVKREHNEDSCMLCTPDDDDELTKTGMLVAVADGMGGASAGELASRLALHTLADTFYARPSAAPVAERLITALEAANRRVYDEAREQPEFEGMGTTLTAIVIRGNRAFGAHVGDSRVYLDRPGVELRQVTDDHSLVAEQVRNGIISEKEARNHAMKNLITRAVGTKASVKVDGFTLRLEKGDTLLICSDGLSNVVDDRTLAKFLEDNNLKKVGHALVERAIEKGGPDNITAALVRITEPPPVGIDDAETRIMTEASKQPEEPPGIWDRLRGLFR